MVLLNGFNLIILLLLLLLLVVFLGFLLNKVPLFFFREGQMILFSLSQLFVSFNVLLLTIQVRVNLRENFCSLFSFLPPLCCSIHQEKVSSVTLYDQRYKELTEKRKEKKREREGESNYCD